MEVLASKWQATWSNMKQHEAIWSNMKQPSAWKSPKKKLLGAWNAQAWKPFAPAWADQLAAQPSKHCFASRWSIVIASDCFEMLRISESQKWLLTAGDRCNRCTKKLWEKAWELWDVMRWQARKISQASFSLKCPLIDPLFKLRSPYRDGLKWQEVLHMEDGLYQEGLIARIIQVWIIMAPHRCRLSWGMLRMTMDDPRLLVLLVSVSLTQGPPLCF